MNKKIFLTVLCSILGFYAFSQDPKSAAVFVKQGIELYDKGDYQGAVGLYEKALDADNDNFFALAELAMTKLALKDFDGTIELCKRAIELHGDREHLDAVYVTYGNALDALDRPNDAMKIYDQGIEKFPNGYMLYFNKGITLTQLKKDEKAIQAFHKAVLIEPRHPSSHNAIARFEGFSGNRIPSLLAFFRFFVLEPEGQRAAANLELMQKVMMDGVEQTGKKNVSVSLNGNMLGDTLPDGSPGENSFSTVDILLTVSSALDFDKKHKKENDREKFLRKFEGICQTLKETRENNFGFYWEYYVPYFIEMFDQKQTETYSYLVFATSDDADVKKWLKNNEDSIRAFYKWSSTYTW